MTLQYKLISFTLILGRISLSLQNEARGFAEFVYAPKEWSIAFSLSLALSYLAIDAHNFDRRGSGVSLSDWRRRCRRANLQFMQTVASLQLSTPLKLRSTHTTASPPLLFPFPLSPSVDDLIDWIHYNATGSERAEFTFSSTILTTSISKLCFYKHQWLQP